MKTGIRGTEIAKLQNLGETVRQIAWPNADDLARKTFDTAKDKEYVNLATSEMYSKIRKLITIAVILGATWYLSGCDEQKTQETYNPNLKYSSLSEFNYSK